MTRTIISEIIVRLYKKGFPKKNIISIAEKRFSTIVNLESKKNPSKANLLRNVDIIIVDNNKRICECYIVDYENKCKANDFSILLKEETINTFSIEIKKYPNDETEFYFDYISLKSIRTVGDYLKRLEKLEYFSSEEKILYRGQTKLEYDLVPSLYRERNKDNHTYAIAESDMISDTIMNYPESFPDDMSFFDKLVKMQHYGLPTRLLDVSTSCLVALYFAVRKRTGDGEVVIYQLKNDELFQYNDEKIQSYEKVMLDNSHSKRDIENISKTYCILPKLNNERIKRQGGAFIFYGIEENIDGYVHCPFFPRRIIIKSKDKESIRNQLKKMLIDSGLLFQDLDHKLEGIKENYD